jgi:membrane-bound lytic murein transglycosylase B
VADDAGGVPLDLAEIVPVEVPGIDAVLDAVPVEATATIRRAEEGLETAIAGQSEASLRLIDAQRKRQEQAIATADADQIARDAADRVTAAQRALTAAEEELAERVEVERRRRAALTAEQDRLRKMAARILATSVDDQYALLGSLDDFTEADRRQAARDRGVDLQSDAVEDARTPWEDARERRRAQDEVVADAQDEAVAALEAQAEANAAQADAGERLAAATEASTTAQTAFDAARDASLDALAERRLARLDARVDGLPMDLVALHAYWRAAQLAPCRIPWWVVAGVGRVETGHGTAFGSRVDAEGNTTVRIIGIPLDGRPGVAAISDTDGGALDGDATWDRAVGPMQFIPGTWRVLAADGNADGERDPHNLYDAATAAVGLLCLGRGDLTTEGAIRGALLSYNQSGPYGSKVLAEGEGYRDAVELPELPPRPGDDLPD